MITVEVVIFLLLLTWQLATIVRRSSLTRQLPASLVLPCGVFLALLLFQLTPMPPAVLRILSPNTYRLYSLSLRGWPQQQPYSFILAKAQATPESVQGQTAVAGAKAASKASADDDASPSLVQPNHEHIIDRGGWSNSFNWRQLSIAPSLSKPALLKILAYGSLFFLVLLCPAATSDGSESEKKFQRIIVSAIILSGFVVAALGIIEFFTWNGKILWLFEPYDWHGPTSMTMLRASGPFVNPDHFGNYLAMVLPVAVGGALFDFDFVPRQIKQEFRLFSGLYAFIILAGLLLSLSRGAWMAAAIGLGVIIFLGGYVPDDARSRLLSRQHHLLRNACIGFFGILAVALAFIGPRGRTQVDIRLSQTTPTDDSFRQRLRMAADTLHMVHDYPVFGVGLGSWPEIFPHYRRPPWTRVFFRETHNDYAQLLAETGIIGFVCLVWLVAVCGREIRRNLSGNDKPAISPVVVALCAGLAAMVVQELSDFAFHIPANALLVTVLLALTLRAGSRELNIRRAGNAVRMYAISGALVAVALIVVAVHQSAIPYPYNIKQAKTVAGAIALMVSHPAEASPHLQLAVLKTDASQEDFESELGIASWLDPINPHISDLYAASLAQSGKESLALAEVARSIENSPSVATHFYLRDSVAPQLTKAEAATIELGFRQAVARKYAGSAKGLADYYELRQQFGAAAKAYLYAATQDCGQEPQLNCLLYAGKGIFASG